MIDFYRVQGRCRVVFSDDLLQKLADTIAEQADGRSQRREALEACLDGLPEKSRRMPKFMLIDGQQRLTTLLIPLSVTRL